MLTLAEIALRAHATACEKGWHDRPMRNYRVDVESREYFAIDHDAVLRSHALIHTELTEAQDEWDTHQLGMRYENGKPEGLIVELGDVIVRVADTMQALGLAFDESLSVTWWVSAQAGPFTISDANTEEVIDSVVRRAVDKATEAARVDDWTTYVVKMSVVVWNVARTAAVHHLDLPAAIEAKMAYNATRPTRHGGKRA